MRLKPWLAPSGCQGFSIRHAHPPRDHGGVAQASVSPDRLRSIGQELLVAHAGALRSGERLHLVFTTPGGLVLRQTVAKVMKQAAKTAGITARLGTHAGRRTVVTSLFVEGDEALEDIARFVGHAKPSTTAGYVKRLGRRPQSVAERAAAILDDYGRREGAE
jgi:integrase